MPAWIHDRAEHLLAKNPSMKKETAFAIATQMSHKLGKTPKGYGTAAGKREAKQKFDEPKKEYIKTPNPGKLDSPKLASSRSEAIQEIGGLGILAVPALDHLQALARARLAKDPSSEGVEKRRFLGDTAGHAMEVGGLGVLARPYFKHLRKKASTPDGHMLACMLEELDKAAATNVRYLLDQMPVEPKVRPASAVAPDPKYRVKLGEQVPGVFGLPSQMAGAVGLTPAKQLEQSQKVGVPKIEQPTTKPLSVKMAFAVSQFSGTLGGGTRDIYRTGEFKTAGPPSEKGEKKGEIKKQSSLVDELIKLNGVAITPKGKLSQTQRVGAPRATPPPGPSISSLSKPVGYGTKAPGAVKGTI